jgi:hypothetical protein
MVPHIIDSAVRLLGPVYYVLHIIVWSSWAPDFFILRALKKLVARPNFIHLSPCSFLPLKKNKKWTTVIGWGQCQVWIYTKVENIPSMIIGNNTHGHRILFNSFYWNPHSLLPTPRSPLQAHAIAFPPNQEREPQEMSNVLARVDSINSPIVVQTQMISTLATGAISIQLKLGAPS